jgi:hypothetical protein
MPALFLDMAIGGNDINVRESFAGNTLGKDLCELSGLRR